MEKPLISLTMKHTLLITEKVKLLDAIQLIL